MNEAIEQEERHSPDRLRTPEEGYSPSLVPTEDIREEFGHNSEGEALNLIQTWKEVDDIIGSPRHEGSSVSPVMKAAVTNGDGSLGEPLPTKCSWTEEFLRAMGALSVAQDEM
ncbi:MAG: hypothetical protein MI864_06535, partial [Pseudomonadales bacterium]|nr:hypothetical protein [Pseudomonadales bacterium]